VLLYRTDDGAKPFQVGGRIIADNLFIVNDSIYTALNEHDPSAWAPPQGYGLNHPPVQGKIRGKSLNITQKHMPGRIMPGIIYLLNF
jgi:hypothetical protein